MKHLLNVDNIHYDLWMGGGAQYVVGKMVKADDVGCAILISGVEHYYTWGTIQHATAA